MRAILAALFVCLSVPAFAMGWSGPWNGIGLHNNASEVAMHVPGDGPVWRWDQKKVMVRVANPVTGGPCGCYASEVVFGHSVRNLWLADAWLKFPRTSPHAGAVAVWPGRHVARVLAANHDGTVTVDDSWATHRVRMAGLVFVDPGR
jgi:hypothetical protein